jgi:hypothetical protein
VVNDGEDELKHNNNTTSVLRSTLRNIVGTNPQSVAPGRMGTGRGGSGNAHRPHVHDAHTSSDERIRGNIPVHLLFVTGYESTVTGMAYGSCCSPFVVNLEYPPETFASFALRVLQYLTGLPSFNVDRCEEKERVRDIMNGDYEIMVNLYVSGHEGRRDPRTKHATRWATVLDINQTITNEQLKSFDGTYVHLFDHNYYFF